MSMRIITLITLVAMVINMTGCYSSRGAKFPVNQAGSYQNTKINSVELCSRVKRIVLKNGTIYYINDEGVSLDTVSTMLLATDIYGNSIDAAAHKVFAIQLDDDDIVYFNEKGGLVNLDNMTIEGITRDSVQLSIDLTDVCSVNGEFDTRKNNGSLGKTAMGGVLGMLGLVVMMAAGLATSD